MLISVEKPRAVDEEAFWLAYQASSVVGMGHLQSRRGATKGDVLAAIPFEERDGKTVAHADYVMGRMMKLGIGVTASGIEVSDFAPRADYQSWCYAYPTNAALIEAAAKSLGDKAGAV